MYKSFKNVFSALNNFIEKNGEYWDKIPQSIFSSLLIASFLKILVILDEKYKSDYLFMFVVSIFILFVLTVIISRGNSHYKKLKIEYSKIEKRNEDLEKLIDVKFEYVTNVVKKDANGKEYYDPSHMYVRLQNYIREAKSLMLLDNVYSNLDEEEPENGFSTPINQERKNWLALIKKKLEDESDFVYQRLFLKFDPELKINESNRNVKSNAIYNYVKGDTLNHISELLAYTKSKSTQCSLKFLAYEKAMETFLIIDHKYLIFQIDGIDITQTMPQDLLIMNNIAGSKDIIKTYEARFEKLSALAISIETVLTVRQTDSKMV